MENLNAEQVINELDCQTKYAKVTNSNVVLISAKCAQFVLGHVQYYEQRIKELAEENEKIGIENFDLVCELSRIREATVRKMQERLKAEMRNTTKYSFGGREYSVIGEAFIDQIAKEMLEGEK